MPLHTSCPHESPLAHARVAPGAQPLLPLHAPHALHVPQSQLVASQLRVRVWEPLPQFPHAWVSVSVMPGVQAPEPPPEHVPYAPQPSHVQSARQLRVRVWEPVPQVPHACISLPTAPSAQTPSPSHAHALHVQSSPHVRCSVPQLPHAPPEPSSPAEHGPAPVQVPSFTQSPPVQTWRCVPQCIQGSVRGAEPGSQSQAVGAEHAAHTPSVHRSTPAPHEPLHARSVVAPTVESESSQSKAASIPSPSTSEAGTHVPAEHISPSTQRGSQTPVSASSALPPPSRRPPSLPRGLTDDPVAQPVISAIANHEHSE